MNHEQFYNTVEDIVLKVLKNKNLLVGNWHLGEVDEVISQTKLKVFIDGGETSVTVSCNPDITFNVGDHVWVIFINGNTRDKFVLCKRAIV